MQNKVKKWADIYEYFSSKGLWIYIMEGITTVIIGIVISFIPLIFFGCFDFSNASSGQSLVKMLLPFPDGWSRLNTFWKLCVIIFSIFNIGNLLKFIYSIPRFIRLHGYFVKTLGISDKDLTTTQWNEVVDQILISDSSHRASLLAIAQQILREDNYMCAIISDSTLLTWRLPPKRQISHFPITRPFIYFFRLAMTDIVLNQNGESIVNGTQSMRAPFISGHLRNRFILLGILLFVFSPFIIFFEMFYIFLDYAQSLRSSNSMLMLREWTTEAKWIIREFNELPHLLDERLERSYFYANLYLDQFPSHFLLPIARMATFVCGTLLSLLIIFGLFTDINTIMSHPIIGGKTIAWLVALMATIYSATSAILKKDPTILSADEALVEVEKWIHHDFRDESNSAHSWETMEKISNLYQPRWAIFLREIMGALLNPFLFCFVLPVKADSIVEFIRKNSVQDPESGWICAFSTFDLSDRGFCGTADQKNKVIRSMSSFDAQGERNPHQQDLLDLSNNDFFMSTSRVQQQNPSLSPLFVNEFSDNNVENYTPNDFFDNVL